MVVETIDVGDATLAWSSGALALSVLGAFAALAAGNRRPGGRPLAAVFAILGALTTLPLMAAFAPMLLIAVPPLLFAFLFALPAALLFYVRALTDARWPRGLLYHALFPASGLAIAIGFWMLPADARRMMLIDGVLPAGNFAAVLAIMTFSLVLIWNLVSLVYLILIAGHLIRYRRRLKDLYSNLASRKYLWIDWFMVALVALWAMVAANLVLDNLADRLLFDTASTSAGATFLLFFLCIWSLHGPDPHPEGLVEETNPDGRAEIEPAQASTREMLKAGKYDRSALTEDQAKRISDRIRAAMANDRLYLDSNLTLQKLASHVATSPNLVSQTLNDTIGETFFDHVNRWRVEAAKPRLLNGDETVLAISIDVGFNSKSTFYKAFKNVTGMAPTLWRRVTTSQNMEPG